MRDLLRNRMTVVQQKTANVLSLQNLKQQNEGVRLTAKELRSTAVETVAANEPNAHRAMAPHTTLEIIKALDEQIRKIEKTHLTGMRPTEDRKRLVEVGVRPATIAFGLFLSEGCREVLRRVVRRKRDPWLDELEDVASESAISQARTRLGGDLLPRRSLIRSMPLALR